MNPTTRTVAAAAAALALAACGEAAKPDPYLQNLPEVGALTLETSASASATTAALAAQVDPWTVPTGGAAGNDLAVVHEKVQRMNEAIRAAFAHVDALTASGGQELAGSVKQWGPAVRCVEPDGAGGCAPGGEARLLLRARRWNDHLGDFVVLATSVAGTSAAGYRPVLAGYLIRGAQDRRGAGKLWVNHENLRAAADGFKGRGHLAAGFAAGPVAKRVTYRMLGFTRDVTDGAGHPPVTAAFHGWRNAAGVVRARVAALANLDGDGPLQELGIWRAVWAAAAGGRAFTVVAGGDVDPAKYWFARACYPAGATTPSYKEWFLCDRTSVNPPRACVLAAGGQGTIDPLVPTSFTGWQQTTCSVDPATEPAELRPPTLAPGDVNDDRDEDGAEHVGLMPEPCPSTPSGIQNPDQTPPGVPGPGPGGMP